MFNLYEALRNHLAQRQNELKVRFVAASVATFSPRSKPDKARVVAGVADVAAIGKAITSTTAIIQWLKKEGAHLYVVGNTLCFRPTDWSQFTIVNAHWRAFFMNSWQSIRSREMARVDKRAGRNFGFGRQLSYAGPQALKDLFGDGYFATVKAHSDRWQAFMNGVDPMKVRDSMTRDRSTARSSCGMPPICGSRLTRATSASPPRRTDCQL